MNSLLRMLLPVLLLAATISQAHVGDVIYPIFELAPSQLPNLHDGTLEDWDEALPNASLTQNDFLSIVPPGREALSFRVFLGWSLAEQRIYFGVERLDDV